MPSAAVAALPANATATPFFQLRPSTPCASGGGLSLAWTGTADSVPIALSPANQPTLATLLLPPRFLQSVRLCSASRPSTLTPKPPYSTSPAANYCCGRLASAAWLT